MNPSIVVKSPSANSKQVIDMPTIKINYPDNHVMPDLLEKKASELGITVEQLIKRFIASGVDQDQTNDPCLPGTSIDDFLKVNDIIKK